MKALKTIRLYPVLFIAALSGMQCGDDPTSNGLGTVRVRVTDTRFPYQFAQAVDMTVSTLEIRAGGASTFQQINTSSQTFDLLALQDGKTDTIGITLLPAGAYDTMRITVSDLSVALTDGRVLTPTLSDSSGIIVSMLPSITIKRDRATDIIVDFDLPRSLIAQGDLSTPSGITGFLFTPAVRAVDLAIVGQITGSVKHNNGTPDILTDDLPVHGLQISVVQAATADTVSVVTDELGEYIAFFLPAGTYSIIANPTDSTAAWSASNVIVTTANPTRQDALTIRQ